MNRGLAQYSSPVPMPLTPKELDRFFERSTLQLGGTIPIRKTQVGIWVPTPVPVVMAAVTALEEMEVLGSDRSTIVDAGTGDGRVLAALAISAGPHRVYGIEADAMFYARASENLETLAQRGLPCDGLHLVEGDYCARATYEAAGLAPMDIGLFLNYPDGHEERLACFVADHASPDARLCLLTHDRTLGVEALVLRGQREVWVAPDQDWLLSIYQGPR